MVTIKTPDGRTIGTAQRQGEVWRTQPIGSSVWTLHYTLEDAGQHCLEFVGWADLA